MEGRARDLRSRLQFSNEIKCKWGGVCVSHSSPPRFSGQSLHPFRGSFGPQTRSHAPICFRLRAALFDPSGPRNPAYQGNVPGTPTPPSPA